jgi:hypothetical protein
MRTLALAFALTSLALASAPIAEAAPVQHRSTGLDASAVSSTDFSAAQRRKKRVRHARPAPRSDFETIRGFTHGAERAQVACTPSGCQPVPRGCLREPGRTFSGEPTGFDAIVCSGR